MLRHVLVALAGTIALLGAGAWALQPAPGKLRPGRLPKEIQAALKPGLTLRLYRDSAAKEPLDARRVRLAALHVPEGGAPSPLLPPGPFAARLTGYVKTPLRAQYTFRLVTTGPATLTINGKQILKTTPAAAGQLTSEPIELAKGYNALEVLLVRPRKGDATVRLSWSGETFPFEPITPEALWSRDDEADLATGKRLREGRLLYATLGCARCHALPGAVTRDKCAMPEMAHEAPSLENAGNRFGADWLARWIAEPRALRPEATMPRVLHGAVAPQQAADLAAFLGTLKGTAPTRSATADASAGERTFAKLGCVTCHRLDEPKAADALNRQSLSFVGAKFLPGALEAFLREPHRHYAWIRMPDFKLDATEAANLAAYLRGQAKGTVAAAATPGSAERGARLFREVGCAQCHRTGPKAAPAAAMLPAPKSQKGCLADGAVQRGKAPDFGLSGTQRSALAAFLATDGSSLLRETPAEFAWRQVQALQCTSCHRRDGGSTRWHAVLEDEGKLPEALPSLTWIGQKLHPDWTEKLLLGKTNRRARPWLKARMPAFPARAAGLALGLSHEHGYAPGEDPRPKHDPKLAQIGAKLIEQQGGFNCIMCHPAGPRKAVEPFEAPGINLEDAARRLRYEYYQRWMREPSRVDVTMRMPVFAPDGRTTALRDVLGGNAHAQFEALWHYMQTLPRKDAPK